MTIDVPAFLRGARREVEFTQKEGKSAKLVRLSRAYSTDQAGLWDAITNKERIPRWFLPVTGDLRLGGSYQLEGHAGGSILVCEEPKHFEITWEFGGEVSWVEVTLNVLGRDKTELVLEHVALDSDKWENYGPGAVGVGWDQLLMGLDLHIKGGGQKVDPALFMEWAMSKEGKAFAAGSSQAWSEASVRAGTDPIKAMAAAEKTTAFYTGVPEGDGTQE